MLQASEKPWPRLQSTFPSSFHTVGSARFLAHKSTCSCALRAGFNGRIRADGGGILTSSSPTRVEMTEQRDTSSFTSTMTSACDQGVEAPRRLGLEAPILDLLTPFTREGNVDFPAFKEYLKVWTYISDISRISLLLLTSLVHVTCRT